MFWITIGALGLCAVGSAAVMGIGAAMGYMMETQEIIRLTETYW